MCFYLFPSVGTQFLLFNGLKAQTKRAAASMILAWVRLDKFGCFSFFLYSKDGLLHAVPSFLFFVSTSRSQCEPNIHSNVLLSKKGVPLYCDDTFLRTSLDCR